MKLKQTDKGDIIRDKKRKYISTSGSGNNFFECLVEHLDTVGEDLLHLCILPGTDLEMVREEIKNRGLNYCEVTKESKIKLSSLKASLMNTDHQYSCLLNSTSLTCGVDINIPRNKSRHHSVFLLATWQIAGAAVAMQMMERIRHARAGMAKTCYIGIKRVGRPPSEMNIPLGLNSCTRWCNNNLGAHLIQTLKKTQQKYLDVFYKTKHREAIYVQYTEESIRYFLQRARFHITEFEGGYGSSMQFERPPVTESLSH